MIVEAQTYENNAKHIDRRIKRYPASVHSATTSSYTFWKTDDSTDWRNRYNFFAHSESWPPCCAAEIGQDAIKQVKSLQRRYKDDHDRNFPNAPL